MKVADFVTITSPLVAGLESHSPRAFRNVWTEGRVEGGDRHELSVLFSDDVIRGLQAQFRRREEWRRGSLGM